MSERLPCCVPFCRRTVRQDNDLRFDEVICAKHWRLADAAVRAVYSRARRRLKRHLAERFLITANLAYKKARKQIFERLPQL